MTQQFPSFHTNPTSSQQGENRTTSQAEKLNEGIGALRSKKSSMNQNQIAQQLSSTSTQPPSVSRNLPQQAPLQVKSYAYPSIHCDPAFLHNLHKYKATSVDHSITRTYLLKPYLYEKLIHFIPEQMHPNLVTLLGFVFILVLVLLCVVYSDGMTSSEVPSWVFYSCAACLFLYQTMDNLDGMQARRTGSSSALGELCDHGTDAIVTSLAAFAWMMVCARGMSTYGFIFSMCPALPFIAATWQEYWDHSLIFSHLNGPTEGLLSVMGGLVFTGLVGLHTIHLPLWELLQHYDIPTMWLQEKFTALGASWMLQHSIVHLANCVVLGVAVLTVFNHFLQIFRHKPRDFPMRLLALVPHSLELLCTYLWLASCEGQEPVDGTEGDFSGSGIPAKYPILFWLNHTFLFAYLASQITLAFVMNAPLARFFYALVPYLIGGANAYFHFLPFSEDFIFGCILVWSVVNYSVFVLDVSQNVSKALDIGVVRLNARQLKRMRQLQEERTEEKEK
eukprot:CAMPEP_0117439464 /NCGR_PEP_ID=MMETSP0759-20121206/2578_1 /TAXON_ID=63605 /ORGANISM="Percolomonas cosmopolitus, Strain WS" /LENGTH=504 /DNA_ID=CAMNT_0005231179 /DNA_START=24 /DNA_END=1538 /DNA_ORIENTATION=-